MISVKVHITGTKPQDFIKEINLKFISVSKGLYALAVAGRDRMRNIIVTSKRREGSQGLLEKAIDVERVGDYFIGLGNTVLLDNKVPYWYLINYGGFSAPAQRGMLVPGYFGNHESPAPGYKGTGIGWQKFTYAPNTFMMKPESPIMAMNYREKTINWLNTIIGIEFDKWTKTTSFQTR